MLKWGKDLGLWPQCDNVCYRSKGETITLKYWIKCDIIVTVASCCGADAEHKIDRLMEEVNGQSF